MKTIIWNNLFEKLEYNEVFNRYTIDNFEYLENNLELYIDLENFINGYKDEDEKTFLDFKYYINCELYEGCTLEDLEDELRMVKEDARVIYNMLKPFINELIKQDAKDQEHINNLINLFYN